MENTYGIGVANRYALFLDEEEDPLEVLKVHELEKEAKKKTKLSEKENEGKPAEPKGKVVVEGKGKAPVVVRKGIKETQNVKPETGKAREENNKTKVIPAGERPERKQRFGGEPREERNNRFNREDRQTSGGGTGGGNSGSDNFTRNPRGGDNTGDERRGRGGQGGPRGTDRAPRGARSAPGERGGYDNRGKREFDRQSGSDRTGVKAVDKRDGGGAHNWGNPLKDDVQEQLNTSEEPQDWAADKSQDWAADKVEGGEAPGAGVEPAADAKEGDAAGEGTTETTPAVEEPVELTLDEYKAIRSTRQKPTYNLRKAGEGEDLSQWKPMYAVVKKKEGEEDEEDSEEYEVAEYPQRVGRQKHVLDIDIHFADSRRGGGGGGRGGGRGRGGPRGAPRGGGGFRNEEGGPREPRGPPAPREPREGGDRSGDERPPERSFRGSRGGEGGPRGGDGGHRGGDGGPRGGGFRGGDRFPRGETYAGRTPRQTAPKVDDEKAFPSLG